MALHHAGDSGTSIRLGDTICLALIGQRCVFPAHGSRAQGSRASGTARARAATTPAVPRAGAS